MAKTYRLAATQVAFKWDDRGGVVNPYSDDFNPDAVPKHIEQNVRQQLALFEKAGRMGADLVVGAEDMQRLGHYGMYLDDLGLFRRLVEPIPGPTSKRIARVARKYQMYIVACYPEKAGRKYYNTGVLFSRSGRILGKYRKVQLPAGETWVYRPGTTFPVFKTELGNVGIAICYDMMFPEIIRCLALEGADIIAIPTMGYGWTENIGDAVVKARAVDCGVTMIVACGKRSQVVNCWGEVLCDAAHRSNVVVTADVDTKARMLHAPNHYATVQTGIADVRERWTRERMAACFRVISSTRPPLMKRYAKGKKLPTTAKDIRRIYEKLKAEHKRVASGKPARYTWTTF
ncbi:MAG TPA: carbon-nitrogen hydrolase family protein [Planctomycetota bacterium]|nr:carbon-nitrogen hydrolase family protein [Planctomycetota bacterium]